MTSRPGAQLRAYAAMRDFLGTGVGGTRFDRKLNEQRLALKAIGQVAAIQKLSEGKAPTQAQFDLAAGEMALGRDANRVRRRPVVVLVVKTFSSRFVAGSRPSQAHETVEIYERWHKEQNENVPSGELPLPGNTAIRKGLGTQWEGVKLLARGGVTFDELPGGRQQRLRESHHGPHDLITIAEVALIANCSYQRAYSLTHRHRFPLPAQIVRGRTRLRLWRRADVTAFAAGEAYPRRVENELRDPYLDTFEVAKLARVTTVAITHGSPRVPKPAVMVGRALFWLKDAVQRHLKEWKRNQG